MPRNYVRTVRQKPYTQYSIEQIDAALVDKNSGMSYRDCAEKHGIPTTVLHRHFTFKTQNPGKRMKKQGGQCVLNNQIEKLIAESLITCSSWGYPLGIYDLRCIVKSYLDRKGKTVRQFKNNMPGREFAMSYLKRHRQLLSTRLCQNIKRARTQVTKETINLYFDNLEKSLNNVLPENIINYDETNLSDDPGRVKIITKRGCKYPERVMNSSKSSTSVMFACTGTGEILPPYTVYKSLHMYDSWVIGGPPNSRYNRSKSGWFDSQCFEDWLLKILIPFLKNKPGKKVIIGDNLSTHLTLEGITMCSKHNIEFVFLPANSTHLTQPLDVAFFRPLKVAWRKILTTWKNGPGKKESSVPKQRFPALLNLLMSSIKENQVSNIQSGFKKCGIIPINRNSVLDMLPPDVAESIDDDTDILQNSLISILKEMRYPSAEQPIKKKTRRRIDCQPGQSVKVHCEEDESSYSNISYTEDSERVNAMENAVVMENSISGSELDDDVRSVESDTETELRYDKKLPLGVQSFTDLKFNDWIVGDFTNSEESKQCSSKNTLFIGNIMSVKEEKVYATFLKYCPTKVDSGKIFMYPEPVDLCWLEKKYILGVVKPPIVLRRGQLKFNVDFNAW